MKILHVITGLADGGAEAVLYRACKQGHSDEHVIVSLQGVGKYGAMLRELGCIVYSLDAYSGLSAIWGLFKLRRIIKEQAPDAVQTWMYHADFLGSLAARLAGCSAIYWGVHNTNLFFGKTRWTTFLVAKINSFFSYWIPAKIIFCAKKSREFHLEFGYCDERSVVIHNGYDTDFFCPDLGARAEVRRGWGVPDDFPVIGLVARLDPDKDHDNLLAAISILRAKGGRFKCVLVGSGLSINNPDLLCKMKSHELDNDPDVILAGQRPDIQRVMNALDIHVLSSSSEAFPNVLCEAMACGTPCVTTDVGDAALIVADTGWIVPSGRPVELAETIGQALKEYLSDQNAWRDRQRRARHRIVDNFSIESMVEAYRLEWMAHGRKGCDF
ncbi:MAG: glycosyltransferase [Castellaniella sp.]|uniref:glycosyltransferase family 4 protein n=1 Tax=Castellaniella sp. TaxID=1955812 RepID=UPI003C720EEA